MHINCKLDKQNVIIVEIQLDGHMIFIAYIDENGNLKKTSRRISITEEDFINIATECYNK